MKCIDGRDVFISFQVLPSGYVTIGSTVGRKSRKPIYAHRYIYEEAFGPIPARHEVHHTCGNRSCVNPGHLVTMTRQEHIQKHRATHCRNGHEMTPENTMRDPFPRCRTCRNAYRRQRKKERKNHGAPLIGVQLAGA